MAFINVSNTLGNAISLGVTNVTGSIIVSILIIMAIIIALAIMFGIPFEYTSVIILPMLLAAMSYYGEFVTIGGIILFYLSMVFTKVFFIK